MKEKSIDCSSKADRKKQHISIECELMHWVGPIFDAL